MASNYTPRRAASSGGPSPRRTPPRDSRYSPESRPARETRVPQQSRSTRDAYGQDTYVRRRPPQKRRRKSGPPLLPVLVLVLLLAVIVVAIVLVVRGCSSKPADDGKTPNSSSSSQVGDGSGSSSSGLTSGVTSGVDDGAATPAPESSTAPTPAPQEEPAAAPEQSGNLMIVGDTAYEYYNFNESVANAYITAVADAGEKLAGTSTVYDMVIPTSIDIDLPETYLEKFQSEINSNDQRKAIEDYILPSIQAMNSSVKTVSIYDTLKAHANEYLYFRTDHHWTQLGAYYAYVEFCKVRGFEPVALDQFDKKEYTGYLGSFYTSSESSALANNPDTVEAYIPRADVTLSYTDKEGTTIGDWPLIADGDQYGQTLKYLIYCAGDQPYEEITNNDMADGPTCIVVKESFGNCFIPFLVNHYKKVYVVDYRDYNGTVSQLAQQVQADDVLCVNNISMTRNESLVNQFSAIF